MILTILLTSFAFGLVQASHFRGMFLSWIVDHTDRAYFPHTGDIKINMTFGTSWRRSDGTGSCTLSSIQNNTAITHGLGWNCGLFSSSGTSTSCGLFGLSIYYCNKFNIGEDYTVGKNTFTTRVPNGINKRFSLSASGCCWVSNMQIGADSSWNVNVDISLRTRPDNSSHVNSSPQLSELPVMYARYLQTTTITIPLWDPDGDTIQCRFARNNAEGGGVYGYYTSIGLTLLPGCKLKIPNSLSMGWYPVAIIAEDFWGLTKLSSIPIQFTFKVTNHVSTTPPPPTTTLPPDSQRFDGCKYYQVLSDKTRSFTYNDWSSYRCDKELFGWYRFMGFAGNRMLSFCPAGQKSEYKCGSFYQGWLTGYHPSKSDGIVSRNVCFSPHNNCQCYQTQQIFMRNCGTFYIYWLDNVPKCNLRYCGAKDNIATVDCKDNRMEILLDKRYFNQSLYKISFRDTTCAAVNKVNTIFLTTPLDQCRTTKKETREHIVYDNVVLMKAKLDHGKVITRNFDQHIQFTCTYNRSGNTGALEFKPTTTVNHTEPGFGRFNLDFQMYTSKSYSTIRTLYPVNVMLRDFLYYEIRLSSTDRDLVLLIEKCYATPTLQRNRAINYTFIDKRCGIDDTVFFHDAVAYKQRFSIQAFRFLNGGQTSFVQCEAFVCKRTSTEHRCLRGCQGNNVHRAKRSIQKRDADDHETPTISANVHIEYGPIKLVKEPRKEGPKSDKPNILVLVMATGIGILVLVVCGFILRAIVKRRKRRSDGRNAKQDMKDVACVIDNPYSKY